MGNEAPAYSPITPPGLDDPKLTQLSQWAQRELDRIGQRFTNHDTVQYNVMYVEPDKPRDGMVVVADGTRWDPGSGGGAYCYFGGVWVFLGPPTPVSLAAYMQRASNLSDVANVTTARNNLLTGVPAFSVHKNGVDQTGVVTGTNTLLTWSTELYDVGSFFAANAWVPPAGKVTMSAAGIAIPGVGTMAAGGSFLTGFMKNGVVYRYGFSIQGSGAAGMVCTMDDIANGTDSYQAFLQMTLSAGTGTVSGVIGSTWFTGHWISP